MKKEGIEKLLKVNLERGKYWKSVMSYIFHEIFIRNICNDIKVTLINS